MDPNRANIVVVVARPNLSTSREASSPHRTRRVACPIYVVNVRAQQRGLKLLLLGNDDLGYVGSERDGDRASGSPRPIAPCFDRRRRVVHRSRDGWRVRVRLFPRQLLLSGDGDDLLTTTPS
jgi:hypothetical protein